MYRLIVMAGLGQSKALKEKEVSDSLSLVSIVYHYITVTLEFLKLSAS